jgi:hypothetical protein
LGELFYCPEEGDGRKEWEGKGCVIERWMDGCGFAAELDRLVFGFGFDSDGIGF